MATSKETLVLVDDFSKIKAIYFPASISDFLVDPFRDNDLSIIISILTWLRNNLYSLWRKMKGSKDFNHKSHFYTKSKERKKILDTLALQILLTALMYAENRSVINDHG